MPQGFLLPHDALGAITARGSLRVAGVLDPSTFQLDDEHGPSGIEYELAQAFADSLGVRLEMLAASSTAEVRAMLRDGHADIAAATIAVASEQQDGALRAGTPFLDVRQQVIQRFDSPRPRSVADLAGRNVMVLARSHAAATLQQLQFAHPQLGWRESTAMDTFDLLRDVVAGRTDYAIVNANEFLLVQELFPRLVASLDLAPSRGLAWTVTDQPTNERLYAEMQRFIAAQEDSGEMDLLRERYFAHLPEINRKALHAFAERVDRQLPRIEAQMRRVGEQEGVDWKLLGAISYQESHWNPAAVSRTGVVGMMMLTESTAKAMGVRDRRDLQQSLRGGARYFRSLLQQLPPQIPAAEREAFALAAYNMGPAHVEDAQRLAQVQGLDPYAWEDVAKQLPLLNKRQWRAHMKHGYARGYEALGFVQRVQHYHRYLSAHSGETDLDDTMRLAMDGSARRARNARGG